MTAAELLRPRHVNPWLVAWVVALATFMEVLDTTIAAVSLRHIAGGLAAGLDESTWVLTSYLVANAIVIPISGWLMTIAGRKRFYMGCTALFTLASALCGLAPSLSALIFFRLLQGASGGGLQPAAQAILADAFPKERHGQAFAFYGIAVVFAPIIGPTLGGWITDNFSWHWIFLINVPVGIVSLLLTAIFVFDPPALVEERKRRLAEGVRIDVVGLILVIVGLGSLELFLDEGERHDWLASPFIRTCAISAAACLSALLVWELRHPRPVVDIPLWRNRNFFAASVVMFSIGFILYGTTQLLPQLLQTLLGYTSTLAGMAMTPGGIAVLFMMPIVGQLLSKYHVQPRTLIGVGLCIMAAAMWHMAGFNLQITFQQAVLARIFQAASLGFLFVPINTIAYAGLPPEKSNNAAALINLVRNIGGSTGIAVCTAMLSRRTQFHHLRLGEHLSSLDPQLQQFLSTVEHLLPAGQPSTLASPSPRALALLDAMVNRQAAMMAYLDIFVFLTYVALAMIPLVFVLRKIQPRGGPTLAH
ncbi:MAG: DHA2 family efflux MFS transporter permease subunit [Candidatus Sumerlaea chitinivorans]|uniref:Inner membrane component of tripartite multidrug resistance system n=1 Tax=Sumerlaea chitinivorans TaxID=2250252 RepID=A0A2Z4Y8S4_SUMC1|nr:Inner membrane component of tripartite multidrug resistance system [Candidatus Sumerlaea chitinivorans]MCX7963791.1 DHA2 family efflux MFS transporter permease subunit [Candidatus Sumerlaea chitinivorans]